MKQTMLAEKGVTKNHWQSRNDLEEITGESTGEKDLE